MCISLPSHLCHYHHSSVNCYGHNKIVICVSSVIHITIYTVSMVLPPLAAIWGADECHISRNFLEGGGQHRISVTDNCYRCPVFKTRWACQIIPHRDASQGWHHTGMSCTVIIHIPHRGFQNLPPPCHFHFYYRLMFLCVTSAT